MKLVSKCRGSQVGTVLSFVRLATDAICRRHRLPAGAIHCDGYLIGRYWLSVNIAVHHASRGTLEWISHRLYRVQPDSLTDCPPVAACILVPMQFSIVSSLCIRLSLCILCPMFVYLYYCHGVLAHVASQLLDVNEQTRLEVPKVSTLTLSLLLITKLNFSSPYSITRCFPYYAKRDWRIKKWEYWCCEWAGTMDALALLIMR